MGFDSQFESVKNLTTLFIYFALFIIPFIRPKSKFDKPESDYIKAEAKRCIDINQKIEKRIIETKKKLFGFRTDQRLIADRERSIRKLLKTNKSQNEIYSELNELDRTIFKDILAKYPERQREKTSKKNVLDKDQKEVSENKLNNKPKRRSKKNLEDNSDK